MDFQKNIFKNALVFYKFNFRKSQCLKTFETTSVIKVFITSGNVRNIDSE